jgi:fermentation-respiration switch protein FrsA (DUF1100 family)
VARAVRATLSRVSVAVKPVAERERVWERARAVRLETKLAVAGFGAVALHILDDNFLQPAAGTGVADHVISGLVPFAAVVGAAIAYPRLRAGARAALAAVFGVLGIAIGGIEPAFYGPKVGLSGDDYTGVVAVAGGILLVCVGAVVAWRSRRRDDRLAWRYTRRLLLTGATLLIALFVLFPLALAYGFSHVARTDTPRGNLGAPYRPVEFEASDGLRLKGWFVPAKNGATVIVYPGLNGTQEHARMLVRHGYGVLVFDRRGEGASEGDPNALGWGFDGDLLGAVAFLRRRTDVDPRRIGGLGLSVGGEALLQSAAQTKQLRAVVSDGAGARSIREDAIEPTLHKLPEIALSAGISAGLSVFSNRLPPPNLKTLAGRITTPVFFIYATRGAGGEERNPQYYDTARGPKQIWHIATTHTHGLRTHRREYERRVVGFFDRTLRPGS